MEIRKTSNPRSLVNIDRAYNLKATRIISETTAALHLYDAVIEGVLG
jgi:hypothetical protein